MPGFQPKTPAELLVETQQVFVNTFGGNVNLNPTSINGIFIQQLTNVAIANNAVQTLLYGGLYNPEVASGIYLDSIGSWNDIEREPATSSSVIVQITGLAGVVIPPNSQILSTNGDAFYNQTLITIAMDGTAIGTFYSIVQAPIPVNADTVNIIVQQLAGWDTVNNSATGILGTNVQSDNSYRYTRKSALAKNSAGTIDAIIAACDQTPDIANFYIVENPEASPNDIQGVTVPAFGIFLSVYGGTNDEIASILYRKKSSGSVMGGSTSYLWTNPVYSWVTFTAKWQIAIGTPVAVTVTLGSNPSYPFDISQQIQNAVSANFNGTDGINDPVKMGVTIYATRFIPSILALGVNTLISCVINGGPSLLLPITLCPILGPDDVTVVIV